ncbi:MAG: DNA-directed RNA polymerase subunit alpha [Bacilli bacterium]|nr:DNA-directed RNA polymerase subunit alpha [Bacilli bacterium]MDD4643568.1 DNA-directed RNA polymerase subunit alpha [Bacilli bacterium]
MIYEKSQYTITEYIENNFYGKFELEPLERGFGTTLGNALRRVMLSSLPGDAIRSVHIDGVMHEFQTLEGVIEDATAIILNLKRVVVRKNCDEDVTIKVSASGEGVLTAGTLQRSPDIEIINPDQEILTLAKGGKVDMELVVGRGRGYVRAEENKRFLSNKIGVIAIDSLYSPIERVNYEVEDARVGQDDSYDKLVLQVWTNGAVLPQEAVKEAASILITQLDRLDDPEFTDAIKNLMKKSTDDPRQKALEMPIEELELSVRAYNCLRRAAIYTVQDLINKTENEMRKIRNLGKISLEEVTNKVKELGLSFKIED